MKKLIALIMLVGASALAADPTVLTDLTLIDDLIVGDDASVGGDLAVTGSIDGDVTGGITLTEQTAVAVTNGQAVTLSAGINYLTSQGGASASTNTITLVRPSGGEFVLIVNTPASTNLLAVAASGAWNSTALELAAGEAATAYGISDADGAGTNAWVGLAQ